MAFRTRSKAAFFFCQQIIAASAYVSLPQNFRNPELGELALTLIQVGTRAVQARLPATPNPDPPRMYVAEGCDGSTANLQHAIRILALHGIDGGDPLVDKELLRSKSMTGMQKLQKQHREKNQTLVFKSILHRDMATTTCKGMVKMGTLAVYVTRRNHLDQVVCMIRDCFVNTNTKSTVYGYAVKGNGKPSNLCFKRRSRKSTVDKAKLRVVEVVPDGDHNRSFLAESLQKAEERVEDGYVRLKKAGFHAPKIASEDLIAFEAGGEKNVQISLKAWAQLLQAWGVKAKNGLVKEYLKSKTNSWSPQRQQGTIYNYHEVAEEMRNLGKEALLRSD